ncbi:unnamed protein product [Phytophthora fragariaefolia]|uniref:Unnamed protein product n=1 Tax=Phytophthora fragariaefolia TaxID=1490495 RepID=A0A9W6XAK1_9STRA|nr:unnamed protein product [Phytophthora fragariaefolia]
MGCYVPASEAVIPIRDRICTRFGTSDDMEENASSFAVEMTETAFILESSTARSLNSVHFRYVLKDGPFPTTGMYGIKTAALSGLPPEVINEAESIYEKLRGAAESTMDASSTSSNINRNLLHHLYVLRYADLDYAGMTGFRRQQN